jgi:hypothetical protein
MLGSAPAAADAVPPPQCGTGAADLCTWSIKATTAMGVTTNVAGGTYGVNPDGSFNFGSVVNSAPVGDGTGSTVSITALSGNTDPILSFGVGATTGALGDTFTFVFNEPIALSGPINAVSKVSYSLTAASTVGAEIQPLNGHVVVAKEVDTSFGGLPPLDKGVDVGDTFLFSPGPDTQNSPVFHASSTLTGNLQYDLMSVQIAFVLTPNSSVGLSGFVQQTAVPVPAAVWLLGAGLLGFAIFGRRRDQVGLRCSAA